MVSRGAAYVRPRHDNYARSAELIAIEAQARTAQRGLWARREYRPIGARAAAAAALAANVNCLRGDAPYRLLELPVAQARVFERRASLAIEGAPTETPFSVVVFGDSFTHWSGPALASLSGARVGVYRGEPQLCLDDASQLEVLADAS